MVSIISIVNISAGRRNLYLDIPDIKRPGGNTATLALASRHTLHLNMRLPVWPKTINFYAGTDPKKDKIWSLYTTQKETLAYLAHSDQGPTRDTVWGDWLTSTNNIVNVSINDANEITFQLAAMPVT